MEASEQTPEQTEVPEDPFADVETDPLAGQEEGEPLPPGVEQGSLSGTDDPPPEEVVQDPEAEEVEPEEGEPLPPDGPVEPGEEQVEQPEDPEEPAAEVEESADPEDQEQPEPPSEPEPEPEASPEPETPVEGSGDASGSEEPPEPPPDETPEPSADADSGKEKPKRKRSPRKRGKAKPKDNREYVVLKQTSSGKWEEAFGREEKGEHLNTGKKEEPTLLAARNGEVALRRAYKLLTATDDEPANFVLVATPAPYFRPKPVNGRVHKQTAITVG